MGSANKVILVGRLGADPELRFTSAGQPVCNLSVATNRVYKDREGNKQEKTNWHKVVAWGKQGERCKEYLAKGRQVYVEGRLENRDYQDRDGNKRFSTEVVSNSIVFLGSSGSSGSSSSSSSSSSSLSSPSSMGMRTPHLGERELSAASMTSEMHHEQAQGTEEKIPF